MASPEPTKIRNVAVVGHGGSGKTSLVESLLHAVGATTRLGRVDDGASILGTDPEAQKRHITINMALAAFTHEGVKINLIDTPGYADFAADQRAGMRVADAAIVFVDASAGIQVGTQIAWNELEARRTPRVFLIGRLDRENADFDEVLGELRETYGIRVVPLHVPVGEHQQLSATIDLLHGQLLKGPKDPVAELPKEEADRVGQYRQQLVESIVETNEDLLTRYLDGKELSYDELRDALHAAVRDGQVVPVLASSAHRHVGYAALLNAIREMLPSPAEAGSLIGKSPSGDEIARKPDLGEKLSAFVFETILSAIGESAIEVAVHRLKEKFGVQVEMHTPRVPYRESIRGKASAQGRYKRQTGGHGQFGDVWLEIEPQPAGTGVVFETHVVGGSVPRNFWPAVEKGVRETSQRGVIAGYPLSDFKATLTDGSFHSVDSSEMSFKIAGSLALQNCVKEADPFLLEPIMTLEVLVPEEQMGDVLADLNSRRGRVLGMESSGAGLQRIRAHVPMAETFRYATDLRSMTGGRGTFSAEILGYEECPSHIAQKVIAAHESEGAETAAAR